MNHYCPWCKEDFSDTKKGHDRHRVHFQRMHCATFILLDPGGTNEILGQMSRPTPSSDLSCFQKGCNFQHKSSDGIKNHYIKEHNHGQKVRSKSTLFPEALAASPGPSHQYSTLPLHDSMVQDQSASNSAKSERASGGSPSPLINPAVALTRSSHTTHARVKVRSHPYHHFPASASSQSQTPATRSARSRLPILPIPAKNSPPLSRAASETSDSNSSTDTHEDETSDANSSMDIHEDETSLEASLARAGLQVITLSQLDTYPVPQLLVCIDCGGAITPGTAAIHVVKDHGAKLNKNESRQLTSHINTLRLTSDSKSISPPKPNGPPIEGLKMTSGYACKHCNYCSKERNSMLQHASTDHADIPGSRSNKSMESVVQTYFKTCPKYFSVNIMTRNCSETDVYRLYLEQQAPVIDACKVLNPPTTTNEIPPLLRVTRWHEHLSPYISTQDDVASLLALMHLPTKNQGESWAGTPLRNTIEEYMKDIRKKTYDQHFGVQCLLMECPRTDQHGKHWQVLSNDITLKHYARLLHQWSHAILVTIEISKYKAKSTYQFPLTNEDVERAKVLKTILQSGSSNGAIEAFHDFFKPFLYPRKFEGSAKDFQKWKHPIECLIAISALQSDGTFKQPKDVTQIFAQLAYHIRGAILYEGLRNMGNFDLDSYRSVEHEAMQNLKPGTESPYNSCIDYQRFASFLAFNTVTPPNTISSKDGMVITYKNFRLDITQWRKGMATLAEEINTLLDEITLHSDYGLKIPKDVNDDWSKNTRGYGFMTDTEFIPDRRALLGALLRDGKLTATVNSEGKVQLGIAKCWAFLHRCELLNEKLALFSFFTAGQTPRVSEFIEHKFTNSTRPRTVFWFDGDIWLVTRRLKPESLTRLEKFVPMKCHPLLTTMLLRYLVLIRPVEEDVVFSLKGAEALMVHKEYLWTRSGERMTADMFHQSLQDHMSAHCGARIGTQPYRQLVVEIGRVFIESGLQVNDDEIDVIANQAGHSAHIAQTKYAAEFGTIANMSSDLLRKYGSASEIWQEITGFRPGYPPMLTLFNKRAIIAVKTSSIVQDPSIFNPSLPTSNALPAGIGQEQIDNLFLRLVTQISGDAEKMKASMRAEVRSAVAEAFASSDLNPSRSTQGPRPQIQQLQQLPSPQPVTIAPTPPVIPPVVPETCSDDYKAEWDDMYCDEPSSRPPSSKSVATETEPTGATDIDVVQVARTADTRSKETLEYLHSLLASHYPGIGRPPSFKSDWQRKGVELALAREESFVAVGPTGAGKTLLLTLPAQNESGFHSYAIIPNKALLQDYVERLKKLNISSMVWVAADGKNGRPIPEGIQVILLALETVTSKPFKDHYFTQKNKAIRLVVDEAHQILTQSQYRSEWKKLEVLAQFPIQRLLFTASLPKRHEKQFLSRYFLPLSTRILRADSHQPNIIYMKFGYDKKTSPYKFVIATAKKLEETMDRNRIGIIFCTTKARALLLSERFTECHWVSDGEDRESNELLWKQGKRRWIASTTGLIHGIDAPNVGATIFWGMPYGLINFYQGAGRGGRDGVPSTAIMIYDKSDLSKTYYMQEDDLGCFTEGQHWLQAEECRRLEFSRLFDGKEAPCVAFDEGTHRCDYCARNSTNGCTGISDAITKLILHPKNPTTWPTQYDYSMDVTEEGSNRVGDIGSLGFVVGSSMTHTTANRPQPPSHLSPPTTAEPSMHSLRNSSLYHLQNREKNEKKRTLDRMTALLNGKCVICWAWKDELNPDHRESLWAGCQPYNGRVKLPSGWIDFKKNFQYTRDYTYCFNCGLPQSDYLPTAHVKKNIPYDCNFADLVALIMWFIRHIPKWWSKAQTAFPGLVPSNMNPKQLAAWGDVEDSHDSFRNSVELVMWFYAEKMRNM